MAVVQSGGTAGARNDVRLSGVGVGQKSAGLQSWSTSALHRCCDFNLFISDYVKQCFTVDVWRNNKKCKQRQTSNRHVTGTNVMNFCAERPHVS